MEGGGVKRTRDEMEEEAVAPVVQAAARDQVTAAVGPAISGDGLMQLMAMLTEMKQEMGAMKQEMNAMNNRMDAMNNRMDAIRQELKEEIKGVSEKVNKLEVRVEALANKGVEIDGAYDAVYYAEWRLVVRSDKYGEEWLGMGVLDATSGKQPDLWCEKQADALYDPEEPWEGDVVPGVEGKLVMAVLSSVKGWPYMLFDEKVVQEEKAESLTGYNAVCDAYIRRRICECGTL
ncbi:unnamed protein product [Trypanosoma congolense IL3000]|uniref:WGS project CAEQ00000000 data, annotated contig 2108 n=1 Tax=Trypanosoma congolense (strain IL3000) TaxID=1068625 RepID=F9WBH7_TRYCI|nr:unnamed protein product [Trypanosoma congolense IL3000]